jgi:heat shock protein HtpX
MSDATPVNLFAQQEDNRTKSRWLVGGFVLFFMWLGFGGDVVLHQLTLDAPPAAYHHDLPWFGVVLTAAGIAIAWYAWHSAADRVLWSLGAWQVVSPGSPEETQLVNVVQEMAIAAGIPTPAVHIIPDDDPNALATGIDPEHSHIAVTRGLLKTCSRDELQAVVGHEMGHIKNLDVRLMTLLAGLVGAVVLLRDGVLRAMRGGSLQGGTGGSRRGKGRDAGPLVYVLLAVWVVSWVLAPLVTQLLTLAVSRKREYLADAMSAQFTRNPLALASALDKIEHAGAATASIKGGVAHLCICDPAGRHVNAREGWLSDLLATHPPMALRVARLRAMGYQELKRSGKFAAAS